MDEKQSGNLTYAFVHNVYIRISTQIFLGSTVQWFTPLKIIFCDDLKGEREFCCQMKMEFLAPVFSLKIQKI